MPTRIDPLVEEGIYHIFNKSIDSKTIFKDELNVRMFLNLIEYYVSSRTPISYSKLKLIEPSIRENIIQKTKIVKYFNVEIFAYCTMPTHYHFLLRYKRQQGITRFIANITNAFTRYFNIKNERKGPIFLPVFKSTRIISHAQLMHVMRYIHLNPYSSSLVKNLIELSIYPWSSLPFYIFENKPPSFLNTSYILRNFKDKETLKKFIFDQAGYQKNLEFIKFRDK